MQNGDDRELTIRFVRAYGLLSKAKIDSMIAEVDDKTKSKYPLELTLQAINMAPDCTID